MSTGKSANNYGYTLIELMMAMAIVSIISAVAIPNYTRYIASTKEKVCIIDRQTILYEYHLYCISESEIALSDFIHIYYTDNEYQMCPSDGKYIASGSGENAMLTCSVHHDFIVKADYDPAKMDFLKSIPTPGLMFEPIITPTVIPEFTPTKVPLNLP